MASKFQKSLVRSLLPLRMLEAVDEKPVHGYAIIVNVRRTYGVYFGPSTVYPLLNQFEAEGLLRSEWQLVEGRQRKLYSLTSKGEMALRVQKLDLESLLKVSQ